METAAEADARMTKEQLAELAEALSILSAKSSIVKERDELKQLMEHNITSEEVRGWRDSRMSAVCHADVARLCRDRNPSSAPRRLSHRKPRSTSASAA